MDLERFTTVGNGRSTALRSRYGGRPLVDQLNVSERSMAAHGQESLKLPDLSALT